MDDQNSRDTRRSFMARTAAGGLAASLPELAAVGGARAEGSHGDPSAEFYNDFLRDCRAADALPWDDGVIARDAAQARYAARLVEHAKSRAGGDESAEAIDAAGWLAKHPEVAIGETVHIGAAEFIAAIGPAGSLALLPSFMGLTSAQLREMLPPPSPEGPRSEPPMGDGPIGPILATRPMIWRAADGRDRPAMVEIGQPFETPKPREQSAGAWCCRARTTGLGDDRYYTLFGRDGVEALGRALVHAGTLASISRFAPVSNWAHLPRCGFPIIPTMADVAENDAEINSLANLPGEPKPDGESAEERMKRLDMDPFRDGMMGDGPIGPIAATREMIWRRDNGAETPVLVEIGVPAEIQAPAYRRLGWGCRYRVTEMQGNVFFTMFGDDGVDALINALESAGYAARMHPGATAWARVPNNGFPMLARSDS